MSREITVEELIANITAHLDEVKNGETLTVVDQDGKQVATITPHTMQEVVKYPFRDLDFGAPVNLPFDVTDLIREDRDYERKNHGF
jgi:antitoxin (DNA-binding transcriptional repressor) of toxin-antitoxin stability system